MLIFNEFSWRHYLPEPMMVIDMMEGEIVFANDWLHKMLGYKAPELIGEKITAIDIHINGTLSWQTYSTTLKRNGRISTHSLYRTHDKNLIPVEIASLYCNEGGEFIVSIIHDISQYTEETEKISISLQEKEHLLREIHHRVKNNLQTISSLLSLGRKKITDQAVADVLQESQNRIHAIATVHELLYKSDQAGRVDMSYYLKHLINALSDSFGLLSHEIEICFEIEPLYFLMDTAMPCGLIVNELVTNAIQHAFDETISKKVIQITLRSNSPEMAILTISDNGIGLPMVSADESKTVGLKLVNILTKQLDGTFHIKREHGTEFEFIFNAPDMIKRVNNV